MAAGSLSEEFSERLHRLVVDRLRTDPEAVLATARQRLQRHLAMHEGGPSEALLRQWPPLLDEGVDRVCQVLTSSDPEHRRLRQASPFSFVVTPSERWRLLRELRHAA